MLFRSQNAILISRILTVLIINLAISLVVMLPAAILYLVQTLDWVGFVGSLIFAIIIPAVSTALSAGFGYIIAYFSKRTRHGTLITVLASLLFIGIYFYFYIKLFTAPKDTFENLGELIASFSRAMPFLAAVSNAVLLKPLEFSIFFIGSIAVSALAYAILSRFYMAVATDVGGTRRTEYMPKRAVANSSLIALLKKEYEKILSSSVYLLNAGFGMIIRVALSILAIVKTNELRAVIASLAPQIEGVSEGGLVAFFVTVATVALSSMDMYSASAVSLEGKNLWIVKSLPLSSRTVLFSKTLAHASLAGVASLITATLLLIAAGGDALAWLIALPNSALISLCFAIFGTVINVALPKFDFENDTQVVKQSLATLVVMLGQMLFAMLVLVGGFFIIKFVGAYAAALIVLILNILTFLSLYFILIKVSVPRFAKL